MDIENSQKIGLIVKPNDARGDKVARDLIAYLHGHNKQVFVDQASASALWQENVEWMRRSELPDRCDLIIVLGGDGTLLSAARAAARKSVPLIGVNLGSLGFLVEILPRQMVERLDQIFGNDYRLEERIMLTATHVRTDKTLNACDACNDIVIKHHGTARMIELNTCIDAALISTMLSDGLIISTPTGSTAYALSSGGPLVEPTLEATLIVPICPHTLSYRPLIVDANKTIEIEYTHQNEDSGLVSIDGQVDMMLEPGDRIVVKPLPYKLRMIQPPQHNYFYTLKTKLRWSEKF